MSSNLLTLPEDFGHFYYAANRSLWARKVFVESRVRDGQKIFGGWHDVELFSKKAQDLVKYYCGFLSWWMQYKAPTFLLVPTPLVLAYYSGVAMRGLATDQTLVWIIARAEFVFMAAWYSQ